MGLLGDVVDWFSDPAHWEGTNGVTHRLVEHVLMSGGATLVALAIALPVGIGLGHLRRGGTLAINVSNVGRALPSFAVLVLFAQLFGLRGWPGFGARPALVALVLLAVPPVVTNAYIGMRDVDADVREAARGMGMTGRQVLWRVELPLALPLVMAGIRTSTVQVVATATLAAATSWGGLGRYILDGFSQRDNPQIFAGALLVAVLAILTEIGLGLVQRAVTPAARRPRPAEVAAPAAPAMPPAA